MLAQSLWLAMTGILCNTSHGGLEELKGSVDDYICNVARDIGVNVDELRVASKMYSACWCMSNKKVHNTIYGPQ